MAIAVACAIAIFGIHATAATPIITNPAIAIPTMALSPSIPIAPTEHTSFTSIDRITSTIDTTDTTNIEAKSKALFYRLFEGFGAVNILIIFFVTLGPIKLIGSFAKMTANAKLALRRQLAFRGFGISTLVIFGVALLGQHILKKWQVDVSVMLMTTGIILFLVALEKVLAQYSLPKAKDASPVDPTIDLTIDPLVFPNILTPYGIAVVLTLSAMFGRMAISLTPVFVLLFVVMLLNLGVMLLARPILFVIKPATLRVLGFVFGVMQVALGLDMILTGLKLEAIGLTLLMAS